MNKSSSCPDPEILAAFIDGRLSGERRRAVLEHLDACEDCYAAFSEAVRFQGEEEPRGRVVRTDRFGSRRWIWPAVAAAAVLVVLVAVPILRMSGSRPVLATLPDGRKVAISAEELVAQIDRSGAEEPARVPSWPAQGFAGTGLTAKTAAFRIGVQLVDLRMASRAGDGESAKVAISGLERTLEAAGLGTRTRDVLSGASTAAAEGRSEDLNDIATRVERTTSRHLNPRFQALGEWAEASRLAASRGDRAYFSSPLFTAVFEEVSREDLPTSASQRLAEIEHQFHPDIAGSEPADMDALQRSFTQLLLESF